jgi:hypothetical protein
MRFWRSKLALLGVLLSRLWWRLAADLYIASAVKNTLYIYHIKQILTCYALVRQRICDADNINKINMLQLTKRLQAMTPSMAAAAMT